jgi:molybdopterin synthase sulfur carrier subunit
MNIPVRLSAGLTESTGSSRLNITMGDESSVADLLAEVQARYPTIESKLAIAVPMVAGRHVSQSEPLVNGQEVALLLPVAGG